MASKNYQMSMYILDELNARFKLITPRNLKFALGRLKGTAERDNCLVHYEID